jgi:prevent-host-death family protein
MQTIAAFQAKTNFSALLKQVEKGEYIVITKHGQPVAKLVPVSNVNPQNIKDTIQRLKQFAKLHKLGGLDWKTLRDEGRR